MTAERNKYKLWYETFLPKVQLAIQDVHGQRQVNHQLIQLSDIYSNYKVKSIAERVKMAKEIEALKQSNREILNKTGSTPYVSSLLSNLNSGNMLQYMNVADNFPNCKTPTISDLSTPEQNT